MENNKVLIISTEKRFSVDSNYRIVNEDNTRSASFWNRYLLYFDKIIVVGRVDNKNIINCKNYVESDNISVFKLPNYQGLFQGLLQLRKLKRSLKQLVVNYNNSSFLLRLPGSIGNLLASFLNNSSIKYSIELVGDPYEVYRTQKGLLAVFLAWKSKKALSFSVAHAHSIAYVTEKYLQSKFPFTHGFSTHYSSIELNKNFLRVRPKVFEKGVLSLVGIGSLEMPYKGVSILLNALIQLNKANIDFRLTWIGGGKLIDELKMVAIKGKIQDKVDFLGTLPNDEIYKIFEVNNIFILPSLTEGLPRAMIEAMASRLICLGSDVGGIPELVNEECLFKSNDINSLVNKLYDVKNRFNHYVTYSDSNYEKACQYLPETLKVKRLNFYNSIIA